MGNADYIRGLEDADELARLIYPVGGKSDFEAGMRDGISRVSVAIAKKLKEARREEEDE
jgi:hypothetical protein